MRIHILTFALAAAALQAGAITATKEYVDRQDADVRDGIAPVVSNTVTKAYVESLGIEAGISAETATNIAEEVSKLSERQGFTPWTVFRDGVDVTARVAQPRYADGQGAWIVAHILEDESMDFDVYGTADQTRLSWSAHTAGSDGVIYYGIRYPMPGYVVGDQEDRPLASIVSVSNAHIAVADLRTNVEARIEGVARAVMTTNVVCDIVTNETVVSEGGWRYSPTSVTLYGTVYVPAASGPMWNEGWLLPVENPEDGADVLPMTAPEGFSADVLHFSYEGMGSITASKDVVTRNTLGLARPSDVSNIVTKAYVEALGIEAGISAETATNIAQFALGRFAETGTVRTAATTSQLNVVSNLAASAEAVAGWHEFDGSATVQYVHGLARLAVPAAATLTANTNGWPNGAAVIADMMPAGAYTVSGIRLVGYNYWPTNRAEIVFWRSGTNVYANVVLTY